MFKTGLAPTAKTFNGHHIPYNISSPLIEAARQPPIEKKLSTREISANIEVFRIYLGYI